jgi:hypothetical protein
MLNLLFRHRISTTLGLVVSLVLLVTPSGWASRVVTVAPSPIGPTLQTMLDNLQVHLRTTVMGEVILDLSSVDPGDASAVAMPAWVLPSLNEQIDLILPLN